tara:strand:- start:512 stop:1195 length:684 start_codon:yes stop_codon:yes gene_type:complete
MLISKRNKFIFVHIDKNGGTSIRNSLDKYHDTKTFFLVSNKIDKIIRMKIFKEDFLFGRYILNFLNKFLKIENNFLSYHHQLKLLNKNQMKKYFKFCVIRNPIDRFYSLYYHNLSHKHSSGFIYAKKGISKFLKEFVIKKKIYSQTDYITDNGKILVDDFILFDRLNEDYQRITKKIIKKKINLNHLNKKRINNKQKLNNKDLQILKRYFKEDFKIYKLLMNKKNVI